MIVVIQCAGRKRRDAGHMIASDGKSVYFVANPAVAPADPRGISARPDDPAADGKPWRELLVDYNKAPGSNPLHLYRAYELYERDVYKRLVDRFSLHNVYILSAGWGLIRADFLTPSYDITFSASADPYKRRRKTDLYDDFQMIAKDTAEDILFLGGKDYLPLFCRLTAGTRGTRTVFYNSDRPPTTNGCKIKRFYTATRISWHYECASCVIDGTV